MATIRATPRLRARLPRLAAGKALVIDYFASSRCGLVIGDITADFGDVPPSETHSNVAEVDGVPVFARHRLIPLFRETSVDLDLHRLPLFRGLTVRLDTPERWLVFLDRPGVVRHGP